MNRLICYDFAYYAFVACREAFMYVSFRIKKRSWDVLLCGGFVSCMRRFRYFSLMMSLWWRISGFMVWLCDELRIDRSINGEVMVVVITCFEILLIVHCAGQKEQKDEERKGKKKRFCKTKTGETNGNGRCQEKWVSHQRLPKLVMGM
jgi:hypothetical protein